MFYEEKCEPCISMEPLINKLESEFELKVNRLDILDNSENKRLLDKHAGLTMVPFFYNEATGAKISGEADYESLKKWSDNKR